MKTFEQLRVSYQSDDQMARAVYAGTLKAMEAMREACIDAMVVNPDEKKAINAMRSIDPVDVLLAAR